MLYDPDFWHEVVGWQKLVDAGVIATDDLDLFSFAHDADGIWQELVRRGLSLPFAEKALEDRVAGIGEVAAK